MRFLVQHSLAHNALKSGDRRAVQKQTDTEHRKLLQPTPAELKRIAAAKGPAKVALKAAAKERAKAKEKRYPKYWVDDKVPRRTVTQSSSWIREVSYNPRNNLANFYIKNCTKPMRRHVTPQVLTKILNAPSIGHELWKRGLCR